MQSTVIIALVAVIILIVIVLRNSTCESLTKKDYARIVRIVNDLDDAKKLNIFQFANAYGPISPYKFAQLVTLRETGNLSTDSVAKLFARV